MYELEYGLTGRRSGVRYEEAIKLADEIMDGGVVQQIRIYEIKRELVQVFDRAK